MIQEIINYTRHLKENLPLIFKQNLEPSKGWRVFIEFDEDGNLINFPGDKGEQWDYYDGNEMSPFLKNIIQFEQQGVRIETNMNKVFDKKKQITSCSPFIVSLKKKNLKTISLKVQVLKE